MSGGSQRDKTAMPCTASVLRDGSALPQTARMRLVCVIVAYCRHADEQLRDAPLRARDDTLCRSERQGLWADGFDAPDGQPCGLTTGAWTSCACPQLHKPQHQQRIYIFGRMRGYPETTLGLTVYVLDSERISPSAEECAHMVQKAHSRKKYPSDLTDEQWAIVVPLLPPAKSSPRGGHPRQVDMRDVLNALFYLNRSGTSPSKTPESANRRRSWRRPLGREDGRRPSVSRPCEGLHPIPASYPTCFQSPSMSHSSTTRTSIRTSGVGYWAHRRRVAREDGDAPRSSPPLTARPVHHQSLLTWPTSAIASSVGGSGS